MTKKKLSLLALAVVTLCLLGLATDRLAQAGAVAHAAGDTQPVVSSAGPVDSRAVPLAPATQAFAAIATALVCGLFGIIALAPLLIGDSAQSLPSASRTNE